MGWLRLTLQGSAMTSSMITPTVLVNGWRVPVRYGENVIPVYAGPNRIDVSCQWLKRFGEATLETTVPSGGQVSADPAVVLKTALASEQVVNGLDDVEVAHLPACEQQQTLDRQVRADRKRDREVKSAGNRHRHLHTSPCGMRSS